MDSKAVSKARIGIQRNLNVGEVPRMKQWFIPGIRWAEPMSLCQLRIHIMKVAELTRGMFERKDKDSSYSGYLSGE